MLYDSNLPEIRAVSPNPDGSVYAVALGGSLAKKVQSVQASQAAQTDQTPTVTTSVTVTADTGGDIKPPTPPLPPSRRKRRPLGNSGRHYRDDGSQHGYHSGREKRDLSHQRRQHRRHTLEFEGRERLRYSAGARDRLAGQVYFTTDASGRIYRLSRDSKLTLVAQTNEAEATRLLNGKARCLRPQAIWGRSIAWGAIEPPARGTYESPVFDAGSVAQWGRLRWQGENGAGKIAMRTRSGNSIRPDATWSDWSDPLTNGAADQEPERAFLAIRRRAHGIRRDCRERERGLFAAEQSSGGAFGHRSDDGFRGCRDCAEGRILRECAEPLQRHRDRYGRFRAVTSTGTSTQTLSRATQQQLMISWQADDPDGDKLVYEVDFRGEGEREWKVLKKDVHDSSLTIDGDALADGRYYFKVTASDREANAPAAAKEADLTSSPVLIDNTPPVIRITSNRRAGSAVDLGFEAADSTSALRRAEYSIDAGSWIRSCRSMAFSIRRPRSSACMSTLCPRASICW